MGTWKYWYPTGNLQQVMSFDNFGRKYGVWLLYYDHDVQQVNYEYEYE